jgi:hypothetical protein
VNQKISGKSAPNKFALIWECAVLYYNGPWLASNWFLALAHVFMSKVGMKAKNAVEIFPVFLLLTTTRNEMIYANKVDI